MEESAKTRMNLVAIQKVDPYAKEILDSCPHVAYYKYISNEWQKSEIEGSFFVYSRVAEPFHSIFINNRLNTNSLVEPLTKPIELQSQPPFLLYRNMRSAISGFWFYCKEDCVRIYGLLEKLIKKSGNSKTESHPQSHHHNQQHPTAFQNVMNGGNNKQDVDIFSMLSKAQAEFSTGPSPAMNVEQKFGEMNINQGPPPPVSHHQPLMKQMSNAMPDITSPNVVSFFAAAQQPNGMVPSMEAQQHVTAAQFIGNSMPIVQQPPMTVDELEKQHRVTSKSPKIEQNLLNNLLQSGNAQQQSTSPQPINLLHQQSGPMANIQQQQQPKPTLITPTMFQASNIEDKAILGAQQSSNNAVNPSNRIEPLTQNQLIQALNYLLENDPDFIRKIHEAYIKSFNKIVTL